MRRWFSLLLAFALLLGSVAPAMAANGGWHSWFLDVPDDDWALPYVLEMQAKGLMQGVGNGLFQPAGPLTRAQAVTVAIRLMGLENGIYGLTEREIGNLLPFSDRNAIPDWARPYIAVAVDHDIVPVAEDGLLRADENATRLWVAVLLVRALGYEAEAQAKMKADLPFRDADLIPASLVGYVAAAVDHELVQGFPDRTFRPNDPLTRAQAAALLSRTDRQLGELGRFRPGFLAGDLVRASERDLTITLTVQGRNRTLDVDPSAPVFLDERRVDLDDLPRGSRVSVVLDAGDRVVMVIAHAPVSSPGTSGVKGEITAIFLPTEMAGGLGLVVLETSGGRERTYPLAPQVSATYNGRALDLKDLRVGDEVTVQVVAGVAVSIDVTRRGSGSGQADQFKGTVTGVYPYSTSFLGSIDVKVGSSTRSVTVAPGAVITKEGNRVDLTDLEVGDQVTVRLAGGIAIRITVDQPARREETVRGEIQTIYPATKSSQARLRLKTDKGSTRTVTLAKNAVIRHGNSRLNVADLRVGDDVQVRLVNGAAEEVRVLSRGPLIEEVKGTIQQIVPATRTAGPKVTVKTAKGNKTVTLASDVAIRHGNRRLQVADLRLGDDVTIKVVDGVGTDMTVNARGPLVEEVKGTVESVEPATRTAKARLTVKTAEGNRRINLADDVSIRQGSKRLRLEDLRKGDQVTVKVVDGTGTEIQVGARGPVIEEVKGQIEAVYAMSITFQSSVVVNTGKESRTIVLAPDVAISHGKQGLTLDDLRKGDRVTVTVTDGTGTAIQVHDRGPVAEEIKGTIAEVYPFSITFQSSIDLHTDDGVRHITLAPEATIHRGEKQITLEELRKGDRATVTLVAGVATAIRVEEQAAEEVTGQVLAVYHVSISFQPSLLIKTAEGPRQIMLGPDTVYTRGKNSLQLEELQAGDRVKVSMVAGIAAAVNLEERPRASVLRGSIIGIADRDITIRLDSRRERTLTLADGVIPTISGSRATVEELYTGDRVQAEVRGDVIIKLEVERRGRDVRHD